MPAFWQFLNNVVYLTIATTSPTSAIHSCDRSGRGQGLQRRLHGLRKLSFLKIARNLPFAYSNR